MAEPVSLEVGGEGLESGGWCAWCRHKCVHVQQHATATKKCQARATGQKCEESLYVCKEDRGIKRGVPCGVCKPGDNGPIPAIGGREGAAKGTYNKNLGRMPIMLQL